MVKKEFMSKPTLAVIHDTRYKRINDPFTYPVRLRVTHNRIQKYFATGKSCTIEMFDVVKGEIADLVEEAKKILVGLSDFRFDVFKMQFEAIRDKTTLSLLPIKDAFELPDEGGIYFLFHQDTLVYIGSSMSIKRRVMSHRHRKRIVFDGVKYILMPDADRFELENREAHLILEHHWPKYNIMIVRRRERIKHLNQVYAQRVKTNYGQVGKN